LIFCLFFI